VVASTCRSSRSASEDGVTISTIAGTGARAPGADGCLDTLDLMSAARVPAVVREFLSGLRARAGRSDVLVVAAALTCYSAIGLVPLFAIGSRVTAALLGPHDVVRTAQGIARYIRGPLQLDKATVAFARTATSAPWWTVLAALLPVSLYAEGTMRCLERFSPVPTRRWRALRGRLLTPLYAAAAVAIILLVVGAVRPLFFDAFGAGLGARLLGVVVAFHISWAICTCLLAIVYRLFGSTPLRLRPLLLAAGFASGWLTCQTLSFTIVIRVISGFARAYGGYAPAGAIAAITFLVYLDHLVVVLGYLLALQGHESPRAGGRRRSVQCADGQQLGYSQQPSPREVG
jgi:membrane protein